MSDGLKKFKNQDLTPSLDEIRKFSLGLAFILAALGGLQVWRGHPAAAGILGTAAAVSLLLGLFLPGAMRPVQMLLAKLGRALGWFNTRVILAFIFYTVFTPAALVMRLLGRDPLKRKFDPAAKTYWMKKPDDTRGPERYEKMF